MGESIRAAGTEFGTPGAVILTVSASGWADAAMGRHMWAMTSAGAAASPAIACPASRPKRVRRNGTVVHPSASAPRNGRRCRADAATAGEETRRGLPIEYLRSRKPAGKPVRGIRFATTVST